MILAIDGNNLCHRIFHTSQAVLTTKDGTPSGVMLGSLKAIRGLLQKFPETNRVIVAFDGGRSVWRRELYPDYKAQRDYGKNDEEKAKSYDGLWKQMEELEKMLHLVAVNCIKIEGQEADDIISRICANSKDHVMIVTSDKDMLQLVSDNVSVYSPYKDIVYSPYNFYEKLGVTREAYIGYRVLVGDTSDNIKGIQGIGDKTAKKLMDEFGHIDNILNAQGDVKKSLLKSKIKRRIFEPEGIRTLAINNKIMSFKHVPVIEEVEQTVKDSLFGEYPSVNGKEFKKWLIKWQYASVLSDYLPWISPFLGLGDE